MGWGDKGNDQGPWGKTPPQGNNSNNSGRGGGKPPEVDQFIRDFQDKFRRFFSPNGNNNFKTVTLVIIGLLAFWLINGFYKIDPDEQGVILRFGKFNRTSDPGLNYRLPSPIESLVVQKVTRINRIEVGFRSTSRLGKSSTPQYLSEESLMLTGDENIVDINFEVQWKISDMQKFIFNLRDPEDTVKSAAESAMREIIGRTQIASALAEGRSSIELQTQQLLQKILNNYDAGVEIVTVKMLKVDPPSAVIDAFRDVQTARADKERAQNEAKSYSNDIIPRAKGDAEKIILDAEAYKKEIIARSQGDAQRFISVYDKYKNSKDVTKKRLYLETMEHILKGMNKVIIDNDGKSQGIVPYLPLNELQKKENKEKKE